jgi:hypothetical protein
MPDRNLTKAERRAKRAAAAGGEGKAGKGAEAAERPKRERKKGARAKKGAEAGPGGAPPETASFEERLDWRLTRLEEAVAAQSKVSEELLERVNAILSDSGPKAAASSEKTG